MKKSKNNVLITLYSHPEFYPPTLSLIGELARKFDSVTVLSRNVLKSTWLYPNNVQRYFVGGYISIRQTEKARFLVKVIHFIRYTLNLLIICRREKPSYLVVCDAIPTISYCLIKFFISRSIKVWYHNHDVLEPHLIKRNSLNFVAIHSERIIFRWLSIFTLPSEQRKSYFPLHTLRGEFYFLPNYPSITYFTKFNGAKTANDKIKIIFQGEICAGHGIEDIIRILANQVNGKVLELWLAGNISSDYRATLLKLAVKFDCVDKLIFLGFVYYSDLPLFTESCHIGLACYSNVGIMNQTIATASNKIYEYCALKLPVLSNCNELSNNYWSTYVWCKLVNFVDDELLDAIEFIDNNYEYLSMEAYKDFLGGLNFQHNFKYIKLNHIE